MSDHARSQIDAAAKMAKAEIVYFDQSVLTATMSPTVGNGVCWALCADWLGNGGSMAYLGVTNWGRRQAKIEALQQGGGRMDQQLSNELSAVGAPYMGSFRRGLKVQLSLIYEFVVGSQGLYFIGFWKSGGSGHAISCRKSHDMITLFDPNFGQVIFRGEEKLKQFRTFLEFLLLHFYMEYDGRFEAWKCKEPESFASINEKS